jgi:hypothetical protein
MYPFIQTVLAAMTVFIPVIAGVFIIFNSLLIWTAKRRYTRGRLHVSQIEFDSKMRLFKLANVAIAGGAVAFTAGAYFLQSYYSKF